jgi:hypothetical protein
MPGVSGYRPGSIGGDWRVRERRRQITATAGQWFSPERWLPYDLINAAAALVLAVSLFLPWFDATVQARGISLAGYLIQPQGTLSGVGGHWYLWMIFGLAILQFAILVARYFPGRRAPTVPGYRELLVALSALSCLAVLIGTFTKPDPWSGQNPGAGFYISVGWSYGTLIALGAAVISLAVGIAAIRDRQAY